MEITPLGRYSKPGYPTRHVLDARPELLRLVPRRWRRNSLVLGALTAACAIVSTRWSPAGSEPGAVSRVAPIFPHGEGQGAFGCVAVSPPVFLSEEEARKVVMEEAKKAGILFAPGSQAIPKAAIPQTSMNFPGDEEETRRMLQRSGAQGSRRPDPPAEAGQFDGADARRRIAWEYVSRDDCLSWVGPYGGPMSTVTNYDLAGAARKLRDGLVKEKPAGTYAVFYDPLVGVDYAAYREAHRGERIEDAYRGVREETEARAREELRKQVRDFIAWLKAQGVI